MKFHRYPFPLPAYSLLSLLYFKKYCIQNFRIKLCVTLTFNKKNFWQIPLKNNLRNFLKYTIAIFFLRTRNIITKNTVVVRFALWNAIEGAVRCSEGKQRLAWFRFPEDLVGVTGSSGATEQPAGLDRCPPLDIREQGRRKVPKRPGGVHVRIGKLLAGDSGRKIAEVIDLQGAIYQRAAGGVLCVAVSTPCTSSPLSRGRFCTYERRKRRSQKSTKRRKKKTFFSRGEKKKNREEEMLTEEKKSESRIVVLAFHHRNDNDDPSSPFYSMSPTPGFILNETPLGLNSAWQG